MVYEFTRVYDKSSNVTNVKDVTRTIKNDVPVFVNVTRDVYGKPVQQTELDAKKNNKVVGKYTIDPATGKVTFTPNPDFVGTPDPVTVQINNKDGKPAKASYTPTVTPKKSQPSWQNTKPYTGVPNDKTESGLTEDMRKNEDSPVKKHISELFKTGSNIATVIGITIVLVLSATLMKASKLMKNRKH